MTFDDLHPLAEVVRGVLLRGGWVDPDVPDAVDDVLLDRAADAIAVVLLIDTAMKHVGALSDSGVEIYREACLERDRCLAALKLRDPYRGAPQ